MANEQQPSMWVPNARNEKVITRCANGVYQAWHNWPCVPSNAQFPPFKEKQLWGAAIDWMANKCSPFILTFMLSKCVRSHLTICQILRPAFIWGMHVVKDCVSVKLFMIMIAKRSLIGSHWKLTRHSELSWNASQPLQTESVWFPVWLLKDCFNTTCGILSL